MKKHNKIIAAVLMLTFLISALSLQMTANATGTVLAADGTVTTVEAESLSTDMSEKTALDENITGTYSGTGYMYQMNSVSGAASKTITIPVSVSKAGIYTIDVHGSAYATKSDPANDTGSFSISAGGSTVALTRNTTVLFGAHPSSTTYSAYSYTGGIYLDTETTSVDLLYTFTGADKYKLVLDCISFQLTQEALATDGSASKIEVDGFTPTKVNISPAYAQLTGVTEGTASGGQYGFLYSGAGGEHTATFEIPVIVLEAGVYSVDFVAFKGGTGSAITLTVGSESEEMLSDGVGVFTTDTANGKNKSYTLTTYECDVFLDPSVTSVTLSMTATGGGYVFIADALTFALTRRVLPTDGTTAYYEAETLNYSAISGMIKGTSNETESGTVSGTGYVYAYKGTAGTWTVDMTIPVAVEKAGLYKVDVDGYTLPSAPFTVTAGNGNTVLSAGESELFTATVNGSTRSVTAWSGDEIYLDESIREVHLSVMREGPLTTLIDRIGFTFTKAALPTDGTTAYFEAETLSYSATSGMIKGTSDETESGTVSGTGYVYAYKGTSGTWSVDMTVPVVVSKAGMYQVTVDGYTFPSAPFTVTSGTRSTVLSAGEDDIFTANINGGERNATTWTGADIYLDTSVREVHLTVTKEGPLTTLIDRVGITLENQSIVTSVSGIVIADETVVEAENGAGAAVVEASGASGAAILGVINRAAEHTMECSVTTAGDYMLEVCGSAGATLTIDGSGAVALGDASTLMLTGGGSFVEQLYPYNTYVLAAPVPLTAGAHSLRIGAIGDETGAAVDYIKLTRMTEPSGLSISSIGDLDIGDTANVVISGINVADMYMVTYSSTENRVATIDGSGVITANRAGRTTIKVTVKKYPISEGIELTTEVTVNDSDIVTVSNVGIANGTFSATITKHTTLDKASCAYLAVYHSATNKRLEFMKTIDLSQAAGIVTVNQPLQLSSGNVVKLFVWTLGDMTPWCNAESITAQ